MKKLIYLIMVLLLLSFSSAYVSNSGLISYYNCSDTVNDSFGTSHGNPYNLSYQPTPFSFSNKGCYFNGTDSTGYFTINNTQITLNNASLSVCFLARFNSTGVRMDAISKYATANNNRSFIMGFGSVATDIYEYLGTASGVSFDSTATNGTITANNWRLYCYSWDSASTGINGMGSVDLYNNGSIINYTAQLNKTTQFYSGFGDIFIGKSSYTAGRAVNGVMKDISIWNRRLSLSEMNQMRDDYFLYNTTPLQQNSSVPCSLIVTKPSDSGAYTGNTVDNSQCKITFTLYSDYGNYHWFYANISGTLNQTVTINITNTPLITDSGNSYDNTDQRLWYSCDGGQNWNKTNAPRYNTAPIYTGNFTPNCNNTLLAVFPKYNVGDKDNYTNGIANQYSSFVNISRLGTSTSGRNITLIEITNKSISENEKYGIIVVGRQHSGEIQSGKVIEGMINQIVNTSDMRNKFHWYFIPMANPDGVYEGRTRITPRGVDMNRDWITRASAEVPLMETFINNTNKTGRLMFIFDLHGSENKGDTADWTYLTTGLSASLTTKINAMQANISKYSSNKATVSSSASTIMLRGWGNSVIGVPTLLMEHVPYTTASSIRSDKELELLGRNYSIAINAYFPATNSSATITNLQATDVSDSIIRITWTKSSVIGYTYSRIYLNGVSVNITSAEAYTFSGLNNLTNYNITVNASTSGGTITAGQQISVNTTYNFNSDLIIDDIGNFDYNKTFTWTQAYLNSTEVNNQSLIITKPNGQVVNLTNRNFSGSSYFFNTQGGEYPAGNYYLKIEAWYNQTLYSFDEKQFTINIGNHIFPIVQVNFSRRGNDTTYPVTWTDVQWRDGDFSSRNDIPFTEATNNWSISMDLKPTPQMYKYNNITLVWVMGTSNVYNYTQISRSNLPNDTNIELIISCTVGGNAKFGYINSSGGYSLLDQKSGCKFSEFEMNESYTTTQELAITGLTTLNGSAISTATICNSATGNCTSGSLPLYLAMFNGTQTLTITTTGNWPYTTTYTSNNNESTTFNQIGNTYINWLRQVDNTTITNPLCYYDSDKTQLITTNGNYYYFAPGTTTMYCLAYTRTEPYTLTINPGETLNTTLYFNWSGATITYKDSTTQNPVNNATLEVYYFGGDYYQNYSTTNSLMTVYYPFPGTYNLRYSSPGYNVRNYYIIVSNDSITPLTLYLLNGTGATNLTVTVIDSVTDPVVNVQVKLLKFDLTTNTFILEEVGTTNSNGVTTVSVLLNSLFYKFIVQRGTDVLKTTDPEVLTTNTKTISVGETNTYGEDVYKYNDYTASLTFNEATGNFRLDYNDADGLGEGTMLVVYTNDNMTYTLYDTTTSTSSSGSILIPTTNVSGRTYSAFAYYVDPNKGGGYSYLAGKTYTYLTSSVFGAFGLFMQILLTLGASSLIFLNAPAAVVLTPLTIGLGNWLGWVQISWGIIIGLIATGILIAYMLMGKK